MSKFKLGDVYLIKFHPSQKAELKKYRPATIISEKVHSIDKRFVLISPLTSKPKQNPLEISLDKQAFLDNKSTLLTWYLWTVDTDRLIHKLGTLSKKDIQKTKQALQKLFS